MNALLARLHGGKLPRILFLDLTLAIVGVGIGLAVGGDWRPVAVQWAMALPGVVYFGYRYVKTQPEPRWEVCYSFPANAPYGSQHYDRTFRSRRRAKWYAWSQDLMLRNTLHIVREKETPDGSRSAGGNRDCSGTPPSQVAATGTGGPGTAFSTGLTHTQSGHLMPGVSFGRPPHLTGGPTHVYVAALAQAQAVQAAANTQMNAMFAAIKNGNGQIVAEVGLPEREDDQPFLAYKTARIMFGTSKAIDASGGPKLGEYGPHLMSAFTGWAYDLSDRAVCHVGGAREHPVPDLSCTCGFYAVPNSDDLQNAMSPDSVLIEVELFGKVIVYERGYRAERQRVLRYGFPTCWYCAGPSTLICCRVAAPWDTAEATLFYPLCDEHLKYVPDANVIYLFPELSVVLGAPCGSEPGWTSKPRQIGS